MSYWSVVSRAHASWPLQGDAPTTAVVAEQGPSATIVGGKTATAMSGVGPRAWLPKALSFDGANDFLSLASDFPNYAGWALEAWFRKSSTHLGTLIELRRNNSARIGVDSDGTVVGGMNDGATWRSIKHPAAVGVWHHVVAVWDTTELRLYVNGSEVGAPLAVAQQNTGLNDPDEIGRAGWGSLLFNGRLAGVRVHPILTANEVAELYAGPEPTLLTQPALIGQHVAGNEVTVFAGDWDSHSNGSLSISTVIQSSPDGTGGWQDVVGTESLSSYTIPPSLEGVFLRLATAASNDGGSSVLATSGPQRVSPASFPFKAVAAATGITGIQRAGVTPTSGVAIGSFFPL